jgi:signal transduction histidine kinase
LAYQHEALRATQALNRQLARQAEQLVQRDRSKNEFLAMLGHELRNPLAGILSGIEVLQMPGLDQHDAEEMRAVAERQVKHVIRLVDDLLDVSRISRGKIRLQKQRVDLVELIARTAEMHHRITEAEGLRMIASLPNEPLWVYADPTRISQ